MKKILVVCPYPEDVAPSQRLKFEQYYDSFREAGYQVTVSPFISHAFWKIVYKKGHLFAKVAYTVGGYLRRIRDLFRAGSFDIVYVHLWVTPFGFPFFERILRKVSKKIVYDIDDLVYLKDLKSKATPMISKFKGAEKPIYLMKQANHVITCTPYLDSFVRNLNQHTTDISSTVNTELYVARENYELRESRLVLGWSGSLSTSKYLHLLDGALKKLKESIDFKLLVIGDGNFRIDGIEVEAMDWSKEKELPTISRFDIGLYPLPDEEWVYGKSGLKAIQYMAMGIPTIATAIGTNFRVMEDGVSGFLVNSEDEWVRKIKLLASDTRLRKTIGQNARRTVESKFSIAANKRVYLNILNELSHHPNQPAKARTGP